MKTRMGVLGLAVVALIVGAVVWRLWQPRPESPPPEVGPVVAVADYRLSGPHTHENLAVFLIHGPETLPGKTFLTLQEALEQNKVIVRETGQVNELSVENLSPDEEVYIQSGEIVKGGQQDRTLQSDLVVSARSGQVPLAAFCVEQGRWSKRGEEASESFSSSPYSLNTKELRMANAVGGADQVEVWAKVAESQARLAHNVGTPVKSADSGSSLQLSLENATVQEAAEKYIRKLSSAPDGHADVIGYAVVVNGKLSGADVYASAGVFRKLWPKLLRSSALEALAAPATDTPAAPPDAETVKAILLEAEKGRVSDHGVGERVHVLRREAERCWMLDTCDRRQGNTVVHRNFLTK